jgi:hypothetical protein
MKNIIIPIILLFTLHSGVFGENGPEQNEKTAASNDADIKVEDELFFGKKFYYGFAFGMIGTGLAFTGAYYAGKKSGGDSRYIKGAIPGLVLTPFLASSGIHLGGRLDGEDGAYTDTLVWTAGGSCLAILTISAAAYGISSLHESYSENSLPHLFYFSLVSIASITYPLIATFCGVEGYNRSKKTAIRSAFYTNGPSLKFNMPDIYINIIGDKREAEAVYNMDLLTLLF